MAKNSMDCDDLTEPSRTGLTRAWIGGDAFKRICRPDPRWP